MSFLSWLFALGGLSIILPVLFHLIRPAPRGRTRFGSLMFLRQSPPRITRRSRIDNWLLLLLRGLVVALLAIAFMRPFFRSAGGLFENNLPGQQIALLIDSSASMQRDDLWRQAVQRARQVITESTPDDRIGLYHYSDQLYSLVSLDTSETTDWASRKALLESQLDSLEPGYLDSQLGSSLTSLAKILAEADGASASEMSHRIVLISDVQSGSDLGELGSESWPENVRVEVAQVTTQNVTNASVRLLSNQELNTASKAGPRVRITNNADSISDEFQVGWSVNGGLSEKAATSVHYVAAGESQVIPLPIPDDTQPESIVVRGDQASFDNSFFVTRIDQQTVRIDWLGNEAADDSQGGLYFLKRIFPETPTRTVEIKTQQSAVDYKFVTGNDPQLVVVNRAVTGDEASALDQLVRRGGSILVALDDPGMLENLAGLLGVNDSPLTPATSATGTRDEYLMLSRIDFSHPLFAPLAGSRYNDFSGIRFWKSVPVILHDDAHCTIVARFDNEAVAIWERRIEKGTVTGVASSWRPGVSQLALSSRFLPLMWSLLKQTQSAGELTQWYEVGQRLTLPKNADQSWQLIFPNATTTEFESPDSESAQSFRFEVPGRYTLKSDSISIPIAVNIRADESNTAPMPVEQLEALGVLTGQRVDRVKEARELKKLGEVQLEGRQRIWKWLILAVLGILLIETLLAGLRTRIATPREATAI